MDNIGHSDAVGSDVERQLTTLGPDVEVDNGFECPRAKEDGWTDWIAPVMGGYHMKCCDCGLIHTIEMRVMQVTERHADGEWSGTDTEPGAYRVVWRVRRYGKHALPRLNNGEIAA